MSKLSISHMSAVEVGPVEFINLAATAGCEEVSVFVQQIGDYQFPTVNNDNFPVVREQLQATGITVGNIEGFMLTPKTEIKSFLPALELGAKLGARSATVLIYDTDEFRAIDKLSGMCNQAATFGLQVGLEFLAMTPRWNTITDAAVLVTKAAQANLGIGVDCLHMVRSGSSAEDLAAVAPELIAYTQLCDGNDLSITQDYAHEASHDRLAPGDGCFPLQSFLRALPAGTHIDIEVPQAHGLPTEQRIRYIVEATKRQLSWAGLR